MKKTVSKKVETLKHKTRPDIFYLLIIILAGILLFGQSINNELVYSDDNLFVLDEHEFNKDLSNTGEIFNNAFYGYYRPLFRLSFMIDAQLGDASVTIYHITNILLHLLSAVLLYYLLKQFAFSKQNSFLGALIFIVHPLMSSVVLWIPGRNESLLAIFMFLSLLMALKYFQSDKPVFLFLHLIIYFIGAFVKETALILPAAILLYMTLFDRKLLKNKRNIILYAAWAIIIITWYLMRQPTVSNIEKSAITGFGPFLDNILSLPAYLGKMILPFKMNTIASYDSISIIAGVAAGAFIFALFRIKQIDKKLIMFGFLWFLLLTVPSLFIKLKGVGDFFDYLEPRAYVPFFGILLIFLTLISRNTGKTKGIILKYSPYIILIALAARTVIYSASFSDRIAFWEVSASNYPDKARLYYGLGKAYIAVNNWDSAEKNMLRGSRLNPDDNDYNLELAYIYLNKNDFGKSNQYALQAVKNEPSKAKAYSYLGASYAALNNLREAEKAWIKAITLDPKIYPPYIYLVEYNLSLGKQEKVKQYMNLLRRNGGELPEETKRILREAGVRFR